jgi:hypothetical protein
VDLGRRQAARRASMFFCQNHALFHEFTME